MVTEAEALEKSHADLARRLADAGRKIESDAKVIVALRGALDEVLRCFDDLERPQTHTSERIRKKYGINEQTAGENKP
jgi:hypothetical protein